MAEAINLATLLRDDDVLLDTSVETKTALLEAAATHLGQTAGVDSAAILAALVNREALGSTAISQGVAVPHAGVEGLTTPAGVVYRLARPIAFEASDNKPVDLVFVLVWPSEKRSGLLATLGGLCRSLRTEAVLRELREATTSTEVRKILDERVSSPPAP